MLINDQQNAWNWDPSRRAIGPWQLDQPIDEAQLAEKFTPLHRYEEEDHDTYQFKDDPHHSKVFVKDGILKAVMCGKFYFNGEDLVGKTPTVVKNILSGNWINKQVGSHYDPNRSITLYELADEVKWITIDSWSTIRKNPNEK
ncbi:MAG: hypothetical protein AAFW73_26675 [Bacteroidota bacterium]